MSESLRINGQDPEFQTSEGKNARFSKSRAEEAMKEQGS